MTPDTPPPPPPRSRFGNVVNTADLAWVSSGDVPDAYRTEERDVARSVKSKLLGYHVERVAPGGITVPYHFHHAEEEMFHVLSGTATLRQGDASGEERVELRPGDFIAFPPGTRLAHQLINTGTEPFVFLAVSTRERLEVCEYPDSDKVMVRAAGKLFPRSAAVDYWAGEPRTERSQGT